MQMFPKHPGKHGRIRVDMPDVHLTPHLPNFKTDVAVSV